MSHSRAFRCLWLARAPPEELGDWELALGCPALAPGAEADLAAVAFAMRRRVREVDQSLAHWLLTRASALEALLQRRRSTKRCGSHASDRRRTTPSPWAPRCPNPRVLRRLGHDSTGHSSLDGQTIFKLPMRFEKPRAFYVYEERFGAGEARAALERGGDKRSSQAPGGVHHRPLTGRRPRRPGD